MRRRGGGPKKKYRLIAEVMHFYRIDATRLPRAALAGLRANIPRLQAMDALRAGGAIGGKRFKRLARLVCHGDERLYNDMVREYLLATQEQQIEVNHGPV